MIDTIKLNVSSVSGTIINSAVLRPLFPNVSRSNSSFESKSRRAGIFNGANLAPQEMRILLPFFQSLVYIIYIVLQQNV